MTERFGDRLCYLAAAIPAMGRGLCAGDYAPAGRQAVWLKRSWL